MPVAAMGWFSDGKIYTRGQTLDAGEMMRAFEQAGTDLVIATVAPKTSPDVTIREIELLAEAAVA
jgi:hypothetical protein